MPLNKSMFKQKFQEAVDSPFESREDLIKLGMSLVLLTLKYSQTVDVVEDLTGFAKGDWK